MGILKWKEKAAQNAESHDDCACSSRNGTCLRDKHVDQWNRIEDSEIKPHTYSHLIFDKEAKTIQWNKKASSINGAALTGDLYVEKWK